MSADDQDRRQLEPSPKRIRDFRKRGEIARSRDAVTVSTIAGGFAGASMFSGQGATALVELMRSSMSGLDLAPATLLPAAIHATVWATVPLGVGALAGATIATLVQLGWPMATKPFGFDLGKVLSFQGIGQMLAPKPAAGRVLMSLAKITVVGGAALVAVRMRSDELLGAPAYGEEVLVQTIVGIVSHVVMLGASALAALAAIDYVFQLRRTNARMRMTPEEAKREHREQEGDPYLKQRRRKRMREMAKQRHEVNVRTADVVVVNPTHYSVALRYRAGESKAPRVVAKGKGPVAKRIRDLARKAGVPIVEEPPLARMLHKLVAEGVEIPAELYQAVAQVLAYVYRIRGRRPQ